MRRRPRISQLLAMASRMITIANPAMVFMPNNGVDILFSWHASCRESNYKAILGVRLWLRIFDPCNSLRVSGQLVPTGWQNISPPMQLNLSLCWQLYSGGFVDAPILQDHLLSNLFSMLSSSLRIAARISLSAAF
jgi:hypothetical protein